LSDPDVPEDPQFASFLRLSLALVGRTKLDLDLAATFYQRARQRPEVKLEALLAFFDATVASERNPADGEAVQKILSSPEFGPPAKQILLLWYLGGFQDADHNWEVESADQYYRALIWETIGAHPPTLSNGYFGHWKYPPES